jgi:hypothetical protein
VGQTVHVGKAGALRVTRPAVSAAAVVAAVLLASLSLTGCSSSPEKEGTSVSAAHHAVIISGSARSVAAPGVRVPQGAVVVTAPDGSATLDTGGRVVFLGRSAEYVVGTGVTAELRRGSAVVDDRSGPSLRLLAGAVSVNADGSTWRVERGFSTRVGVFSGSVQVAMGGHSQTLPALYQVVVAGLQLPAKTPLVLRDDDAERRVALQLVDDDVALTNEAKVLNRSHDGRALVRLASDVGHERCDQPSSERAGEWRGRGARWWHDGRFDRRHHEWYDGQRWRSHGRKRHRRVDKRCDRRRHGWRDQWFVGLDRWTDADDVAEPGRRPGQRLGRHGDRPARCEPVTVAAAERSHVPTATGHLLVACPGVQLTHVVRTRGGARRR